MTKQQTDALLTTAELCEQLGITRGTLFRWKAEGCPVTVLGPRTNRWDQQAVTRWAEAQNDELLT